MSKTIGVLVVDKPPLVTSHDVVEAVRRIIGIKRVGHCGTLDPGATGVLVIMVGRATRLSQYLLVDPKEYCGEMEFGIETDTYDILGNIVSEKPCNASEEEIKEILHKYTGTFLQEPPMVSAKKVKGVPLYKLAREGKKVKVEKKEVTVYEMDIGRITRNDENNRVTVSFRVVCSGGTYVRSIAHEVGRELGCGGVLGKLERTRSGLFTIGQSRTLEEIEELADHGKLEEALIPPVEALANYNKVTVRQGYVSRVANGASLQLRMVKGFKFDFSRREVIKMIDERGRFLGLAKWKGELAKKPQDVVAKPFLVMIS